MKIPFTYRLIPMFLTINFFIQIYLNPTFGITPDSMDYIRIAKDLPNIKNSLFPIFYPTVIKFFNLFIHDFFFTTKLISLLSLYFSLAITYYKNFFWKQTWILLCFPYFLDIYHYSWSETILISLLVMFVYVSHNYLEKNMPTKKYIFSNTLLMTSMLFCKYSTSGIIIGFGVYSCFLFLKKRKLSIPMLFSFGITSFIFLLYLSINKYYTGEFTGIRIPAVKSYNALKLSIFNIIYNLNPLINKRFFLNFNINYITLAVVTILIYLPILYISLKKIKNNLSAQLTLVCSFSFLLLTLYSFITVKIDLLDARLLMPFLFLFFINLVFLLGNKLLKYGRAYPVF